MSNPSSSSCILKSESCLAKACIRQDNELMKREGILNLGCSLGSSQAMVILWDASYFTRLWCVFEIAVFMKQRQLSRTQINNKREDWLKVLPTSWGRLTMLLLFMTLIYVCIFRSVDEGPVRGQLFGPATVREFLISQVAAACFIFLLFLCAGRGVGGMRLGSLIDPLFGAWKAFHGPQLTCGT